MVAVFICFTTALIFRSETVQSMRDVFLDPKWRRRVGYICCVDRNIYIFFNFTFLAIDEIPT